MKKKQERGLGNRNIRSVLQAEIHQAVSRSVDQCVALIHGQLQGLANSQNLSAAILSKVLYFPALFISVLRQLTAFKYFLSKVRQPA